MSAFTPAGSGGIPVATTVQGLVKGQPVISNVSVGLVESTLLIPANVVAFQIRNRLNADLLIATTAGGDQMTVSRGTVWYEEGINNSLPITFYITAAQAGSIVELISWVG